MSAPRPLERCRICGSRELTQVLDLGEQAMTGVFPRSRDEPVTRGPLRLVKCGGTNACGLLQLAHSYDPAEMYGANYGYRSGLNASMVRHLEAKVARILDTVALRPGDLVVDIGSNDGTTLKAYPAGDWRLVGIDPTGAKFREHYPPHVELLPEFFSVAALQRHVGPARARVITSFSMFYDLESPLQFMQEVAGALAPDGIWVFEQSYMPTMLEMNSYDTVCHEHLEYYSLRQIQWMTERAGLKIVDVEFNDINGGSFSVIAARTDSPMSAAADLDALLERERALGLNGLEPYRAFAGRVEQSKRGLRDFLERARREDKTVYGLGASTKGNVLLQYCGLSQSDLPAIGEVNEDKWGCYTPGTLIPIAPEHEVLAKNPDYLLVLPWHFRGFFLANPTLEKHALVFPLPLLETVRGPTSASR